MTLARASLVVAGVASLVAACGGAQPPPQPHSSNEALKPNYGAPKSTPEETTEPEPGGPYGLVIGNVASTDMTALVTIKSARIEGQGGAPPSTTGYVNHVYVVDVVTCIHGCGTVQSFTFADMAEAGIPTQKVGDTFVVSACRSSPGLYYTPDVGYLIPATALPASAVSELVAKPPPRTDSVCKPAP